MNRQIDQQEEIRFKRIVRGELEPSKHLAVSKVSNDTFSITQFGVVKYQTGESTSGPLPGVIRLTTNSLMKMLHILIWAVVRLDEREISPEDAMFIRELKKISQLPQKKLEDEMWQINYPPTNFKGQSYREFPQVEEIPRKKF